MADIINIAEFDFDTNKLIQSLTETKTAINAQNRELSNFRKSINDVNKELNSLEKENTSILRQMTLLRNEGKENTDAYKKLKSQLDLNEDSTKKLKDQEEKLVQTVIELEPKLTALKNEYKLTSSVLKAVTDDTGEFVSVTQKATEAIERQTNSIASARANNTEILAIRNQLNVKTRNGIALNEEELKLADLLNSKLDENNAFIKENVSQYEKQKINIGNYANSIKEAFSDLNIFTRDGLINFIAKSEEAGGASNLLNERFKQIRTGLTGLIKSALAFIATPLGAAITLLAGFAYAAKKVWEYNDSISESIKLTKQLTELTGTMADNVRVKAQGIADTFKQDFQKTLEVASQISERTGKSITNVLDEINNGFIKGANAGGNYLDSLEEMFPRLEKGGLTLSEVNALIEQSQGVFSGDKFVDTIGEAVVALEEFTQAQSDALTNAFGQQFSDRISKGVNSGKMSAKEALLEIYNEAERVNLSTQQWATISADVFKGIGEDIGGAEIILKNYNEALENVNRNLTESEKITLEISKANQELAKSKDEALKSDGVIKFQKSLELLWVKTQIVFFQLLKGIRGLYEWFWEISQRAESLSSIWNNLQKIGTALWKVFDTLFTSLSRIAESLGLGQKEGKGFMNAILLIIDPVKKLEVGLKMFTDVLVWLIKQFEESFIRAEAFGRAIRQTYEQIKNLDFSSLLDISDKVDKNTESIKRENEAFRARKDAIKATSDLTDVMLSMQIQKGKEIVDVTKGQAKSEKDLEKEREKAFQKQLQRMNEELDLWIEKQGIKAKTLQEELEFQRQVAADSIKILNYQKDQEKITLTKHASEVLKIENDLAKLTAEIVAQNAEDELNEWLRLNQSILADENRLTDDLLIEEERRLNQAQQLRVQYEQTRFEEGLINERDYQNQILAITEETEKAKNEIQKRYSEQQRAEAVVMRQLQFEEDLIKLQEEGATEFELQQAERDTQFQQEIEKINEEREQNLISEDEYQKRFSNIERKWNLETAQAIEQIEEAKQDAKMQLASQSFALASEILGKETVAGKAAAIAQTTIDTYKAAQSAYSAMAGIPVVGPALGVVAAGLAVTTGLLNVKKIVSTKTPTVQGFATGGRIIGGMPISRPNGDDVLITAKRGEVILNEDQQRAAGGYNFFSALGIPGFNTGGIVGGSSVLPSQSVFVQNQLMSQINMDGITEAVKSGITESTESLASAVRQGSSEGSAQGSQTGIRELSSDRGLVVESSL